MTIESLNPMVGVATTPAIYGAIALSSVYRLVLGIVVFCSSGMGMWLSIFMVGPRSKFKRVHETTLWVQRNAHQGEQALPLRAK